MTQAADGPEVAASADVQPIDTQPIDVVRIWRARQSGLPPAGRLRQLGEPHPDHADAEGEGRRRQSPAWIVTWAALIATAVVVAVATMATVAHRLATG